MCMTCGERAERIYEGAESDQYRCQACGQEFYVDWRRGEPEEPCWPETETGLAEARRIFALLKASREARKRAAQPPGQP